MVEKHLNREMLIKSAAGKDFPVAEWARRHISECAYCAGELDSLLSAVNKPPAVPESCPRALFDGEYSGAVFIPDFGGTGVPPEFRLPVMAVSEPVFDTQAARETVDVINMHYYPGLALQGDLITGAEARFERAVLCTWSVRTIFKSRLDNGSFTGHIKARTLNYVLNILTNSDKSLPEDCDCALCTAFVRENMPETKLRDSLMAYYDFPN